MSITKFSLSSYSHHNVLHLDTDQLEEGQVPPTEVLKNDEMMYIPILASLKQMLNQDDILSHVG